MYTENNSKSLHLSIEASLKKLRTTYIDLLYVHWWDWEIIFEEVMRSLHTLVLARKVLYLRCGLSFSFLLKPPTAIMSRQGAWQFHAFDFVDDNSFDSLQDRWIDRWVYSREFEFVIRALKHFRANMCIMKV